MTASPNDSHADDFFGHFEHPEAWTKASLGLKRIALAIVGNDPDAEDVLQGALLEALRDSNRPLSLGWMRKLVRFRALDLLRVKRRDPLPLEEPGSVERAAPGTDAVWILDAQRSVLEAVRSLKEPYRSTIVLRYFEAKGPKEIACELGVPERTIKTRLTRAHAQLRARLGAEYQDSFGNWAPALLAFSGSTGSKVSPFALPIAGALVVKKVALFAVLLLAVWLPLALMGEEPAPLDSPLPDSGVEAVAGAGGLILGEEAQPAPQGRIQDSSPGVPQAEGQVEFAFPELAEAESGSLKIRLLWSDGLPAKHWKIGLVPENAADAFLMSRTLYTDAAGFVEVHRLTPGPVSVYFHRLGVEKVEVLAGETTWVEKEAQRGARLTGRVLGPFGQPVAGAMVFVADSRGGDSLPEPAALADGFGNFEIESVFSRSYVSARAAEYAPSIPVDIGVTTGESMELDLTLRAASASVRGIALSPSGRPVVGAKVRIEHTLPATDTNGRTGYPLAFVLQTDAGGRFETDQVGAGRLRISARTASWQPWTSLVQLDAGEDRQVEIRFERGVDLGGVVRGEDGAPIPDTLLFSGEAVSLTSYRVRTDAEGRFLIRGLPAGASDIKVFNKEFEELSTSVILQSGIENQVEFTLHRLQSVSGEVVDESGAPLEHWYVAVETEKGLWSAGSWTDSDGEFEIVGIPDRATDVIVTTEDFQESATRFAVPRVLPREGKLRIVVPDAVAPNSSMRLRLEVEGKPAPVETRVRLRSDSPLTHRDVHPDMDGVVVMAGLASQRFYLDVTLEGYAPLTKTVYLGVQEDLDLGELSMTRGGRVSVQVDGALAGSPATFRVLDEAGRTLQSFASEGQVTLSPPLAEGDVILGYFPREGAIQSVEVRVDVGATTGVHFTSQAGARRTILITGDASSVPFRTQADVADYRGQVLFQTGDLRRLQDGSGITRIELPGLSLGTYRLRIQAPDGAPHESWFDVDSLDPKQLEVELSW